MLCGGSLAIIRLISKYALQKSQGVQEEDFRSLLPLGLSVVGACDASLGGLSVQ